MIGRPLGHSWSNLTSLNNKGPGLEASIGRRALAAS